VTRALPRRGELLDAVSQHPTGGLRSLGSRSRHRLEDQRLDGQSESEEERAANDEQPISGGQLANVTSSGRTAEDHQHAGAEAPERQDPER